MGKSAARVMKPEVIPPLRDGDRLTREEFWRRYEASPHVTRAELIRGVVHVISEQPAKGKESNVPPISGGGHGGPHSYAIGWLFHYRVYTPGVDSSAPSTLIAPSDDTAPEPDALLRILPECGGQTTMDAQGYYHGAPELVFEVSNTTMANDLGAKLESYQADGVREYIVWRTAARVIDWFRLNRSHRYVPLAPDGDGHLQSRVFPGLRLDASALLSGDLPQVLRVLDQGLASPEHAAFVERLRRRAARQRR